MNDPVKCLPVPIEREDMGKVVVFVSAVPRKHHCTCGRFLGESTAIVGTMTTKCPSCGAWRKLDFAETNHLVQSA